MLVFITSMAEDDFQKRAKGFVAGLKRDIDGLDKVIEDAEANRVRIRQQLALFEQSLAVYRQVMDLPRTPDEQLPLIGGLQGTIADMAAQVIAAREGNVTVAQLVDVLTAAGKFKTPENKRTNYGTVYGTLQADARFGKVSGKGEFFLVEDRSAEEFASTAPPDN